MISGIGRGKRVTAQTITVFRNQLRRTFFKVVVYILDYSHCPTLYYRRAKPEFGWE